MNPSESKYPLPLRPEEVDVTPDMAGDWLDYRSHPKLRPMSKTVVARYADDMAHGRWPETPEPMIFDTEGWIISAQHRLAAIRLSGKTMRFWIFPNQSRDIADAVDQGYKRKTAQLLHVPHAAQVAAAAKWLAGDGDIMRNLARMPRITTAEVLDTVAWWPELTWYTDDVYQVWRKTRIPRPAHMAVLAQAQRTEFRHLVPEWVEGLKTGVNLSEHDPRRQLRERFITGHKQLAGSAQRPQVYGLIAKAWNAWATGEHKTILRWMVTEAIPDVVGLDAARKAA